LFIDRAADNGIFVQSSSVSFSDITVDRTVPAKTRFAPAIALRSSKLRLVERS